MNGLRTRFTLDRVAQKVHNDLSHRGDRAVVIGAALIALLLFVLTKMGVIA
jgi:hypothetical protein